MSLPARKNQMEKFDDIRASPADSSVPAALTKARYVPFPWRGLGVGLFVCPLIIFWSEYTEIVSNGADLIAMSLVMSVVVMFLALLGINALLRQFAPKWSMSRADLLIAYIINSVSVGMTGLGMMQFLVNYLTGSFYFRTTENGWGNWLHLLRPWALPRADVIPAYYDGHSSFFTEQHMLGWARPILVWSLFLIMLATCLYCLAVLLRRQWMDNEQLQFPIASIPLEIIKDSAERPIWGDSVLWSGFALAFGLETLAVIHYSFNFACPYLPIKANEPAFDLTQYLYGSQVTGLSAFTASLYPLVIGLAFLLSLDLSFSCWFFFVVSKAQVVIATLYGFRDPHDFWLQGPPYIQFQGIGSFIVLGFIALTRAWPSLKASFLESFLRREKGAKEVASDTDEPISYRSAYIGFFACAAGMITFAYALGIALPVAVAFFAIVIVYSIVATRIRAEAGLAFGQAPVPMAHGSIFEIAGTHSFSHQTLVGLGLLGWFDTDCRSNRMPYDMDSMKIAKDGGINPRHLTAAVASGTLIAIISGWICLLGIYYHFGAVTTNNWRFLNGQYPFTDINRWISAPTGLNVSGLTATAAGAGVTIALAILRRSCLGWPLHPLGYALASCDGRGWFWLPMLIGWFCKLNVLKYGGAVGYRRVLPFFIGLIIGDYVAGGGWAVFFLLTGIHGYKTFP